MTVTNLQTFSGEVEIPDGNLQLKKILELSANNSSTSNTGILISRNLGATSNSNVIVYFDEATESLRVGHTLNAASDSELIMDTSNALVMNVFGDVEASFFKGDGGLLSNIVTDLQSVSEGGSSTDRTVVLSNVTTGVEISSNAVVSGNLTAGIFFGDGGLLSNITQTLQGITEIGNTTSQTLEFNNVTTGFVTTANVGVVNTNPNYNFSVGSNLHVHDTGINGNTLSVTGNMYVSSRITLGSVEILPGYGLENVTNISNLAHSTLRFSNATTAFVTTAKAGIGIEPDASDVGVAGLHVDGHLRLGGPAGTDENSDIYLRSAGQLNIESNDTDTDNQYTALALRAGNLNESNIIVEGALSDTTKQYISFATRNTERMKIDREGNVTVGYDSTSHKLDVAGSANVSTLHAANLVINTVSVSVLYGLDETLENGNTTSNSMTVGGIEISGASGELFRYTDGTRTVYGGCDGNEPWFGTSSDNDLRIVTNGTERMRISNDGLVGIQNSTPLQPLHVKGNDENPVIYMSEATNNRYSSGFGSHHVSGVGQRLDFYNGDSGANGTSLSSSHIRMSIDAYGNVGIGTTNPTRSLHIYRGQSYVSGGTSNNSAFEILQQLGTNDYLYLGQHRAQFRINSGQGSWGNRSLELAVLDSGTGVIQACAQNEGYFPLLVNPGGGNVGVGVLGVSGTYKFTVGGNMEIGTSATDYRHLRIGGGNSNGFLYGAYAAYADGIHLGYNYYHDNTNPVVANTSGMTSRITCGYGYIALYTGGTNAAPTNLGYFQDQNGLVGIGVNPPTHRLDVNGTLRVRGNSTYLDWQNNRIIMSYDNNFRQGIHFDSGYRVMRLFSTTNDASPGTGGSIAFHTRHGAGSSDTDYGTERMRISYAGNVGINTASPDSKLHITAGFTPDDTWVDVLKIDADANWNLRLAQYHDVGSYVGYGIRHRWNGSEYMPVIFNQNTVGIGYANATAPSAVPAKLSIRSNYYGGQSDGFCIDASSGGATYELRLHPYVQGNSQVGYNFRVNNVGSSHDYSLVLGYNGYVGVGTAIPRQKLEVADGHIAIVQNAWKTATADDQLAGKIDFHLGGSSGELATPVATIEAYDKYQSGGSYVGALAFKTTGTERMRINESGYVGIGQNYNNPHAPLSIATTRNADTWSSGATQLSVLHNNGQGAFYGMSLGVSATYGDGVIQTYRADTGVADYDLRLQPNSGNVGIGTHTPAQKFHVHFPGIAWPNFTIRGTSLWGDGLTAANEYNGTQYATLHGAMFQNLHVVPATVGGNAYIRLGRAGGVASGNYWEVACRTDGSFHIANNQVPSTGGGIFFIGGGADIRSARTRAYRDGTYDYTTTGGGTNVRVPYNYASGEQIWDNTNERYTAPYAGEYVIGGCFMAFPSPSNCIYIWAQIWRFNSSGGTINTGTPLGMHTPINGYNTVHFYYTTDLNAGDYIEVRYHFQAISGQVATANLHASWGEINVHCIRRY